ncbi:pyridoxal-dependent decarboxylase [Streptomyces sp. TR02-1]|uniref:pyridoxal-dependent decarboxylase n=1 Tax=Streptomyces sp. TR02-1 TaxID=3385977 RepID=UPI0039A3007C
MPAAETAPTPAAADQHPGDQPPGEEALHIGRTGVDPHADAAHIRDLVEAQRHKEARHIGFPGNLAPDHSAALAPALSVLFNNVGDPDSPDTSDVGTKPYEQQVIAFLAELFGAHRDDVFGYVTASGTAANEHGLHTARTRLPDAPLYYSPGSAHYSIPLLAGKLRIEAVPIASNNDGTMNPAALHAACAARPGRAAIIAATIGTTMTGASDDLPALRHAATTAGTVHLHVDGALGALIAATTPGLPDCGFTAGTDTLALSGHKLLGSPIPYGITLTRTEHTTPTRSGPYTGATNHTLDCSRSGLAALIAWLRLRELGRTGLQAMVARCQHNAHYLHHRLKALGAYQPHLHEGALTVTFNAPAPWVTHRWSLPVVHGRAHAITVEHVTRPLLDAFLDDLAHGMPEEAAA